jgi:hypothetical protein
LNKGLFFIGTILSILLLCSSTGYLAVQYATTNTSNAAKNFSVATNQTASELGQNPFSVLNKAGKK